MTLQPYENTLGIDELRREVRRAWDELAAIRKDLKDLPEVPSIKMQSAFISSSRWMGFHEAFARGKKMQRELGLEAIPPKAEYELAAAHYNFIREAVLAKIDAEGLPVPPQEAKEA